MSNLTALSVAHKRGRLPYAKVRTALRTGDLILQSGRGPFSLAIQVATGCPWSHTAMVVRDPVTDRVLVWESAGKGVSDDDLDRQCKWSAGLTPLSEKLVAKPGPKFYLPNNDHLGDVAVRRVEGELPGGALERLAAFRQKVYGLPYEADKLELLKAVLGRLGNRREDLSSLFCSELVAATLGEMGLLPPTRSANSYRPRDFSTYEKLELTGGCRLGAELLLEEKV